MKRWWRRQAQRQRRWITRDDKIRREFNRGIQMTPRRARVVEKTFRLTWLIWLAAAIVGRCLHSFHAIAVRRFVRSLRFALRGSNRVHVSRHGERRRIAGERDRECDEQGQNTANHRLPYSRSMRLLSPQGVIPGAEWRSSRVCEETVNDEGRRPRPPPRLQAITSPFRSSLR